MRNELYAVYVWYAVDVRTNVRYIRKRRSGAGRLYSIMPSTSSMMPRRAQCRDAHASTRNVQKQMRSRGAHRQSFFDELADDRIRGTVSSFRMLGKAKQGLSSTIINTVLIEHRPPDLHARLKSCSFWKFGKFSGVNAGPFPETLFGAAVAASPRW